MRGRALQAYPRGSIKVVPGATDTACGADPPRFVLVPAESEFVHGCIRYAGWNDAPVSQLLRVLCISLYTFSVLFLCQSVLLPRACWPSDGEAFIMKAGSHGVAAAYNKLKSFCTNSNARRACIA